MDVDSEDRSDDRWLVIDGRRWRRKDPNLAEETRSQLVDELMTARRQIRSAGNEAELENLRLRVADAKVALGERGPRWWDAPTVDDVRVRAAAIVRALTRANGAPPTAEVIAAASRAERIDLGACVVADALRDERAPADVMRSTCDPTSHQRERTSGGEEDGVTRTSSDTRGAGS